MPARVTLRRCFVQGVGVHGKQSSALFSSLACGVTMVDTVAFSGPRAGVNLNDGLCGGHVLDRNVLFDWVRETQDHGPINTWSRALYLTDGAPEQPAWNRVAGNLILNGPSPNRDLGNLWPALDNDDGSAFFTATANVAVYGAFKNYLGCVVPRQRRTAASAAPRAAPRHTIFQPPRPRRPARDPPPVTAPGTTRSGRAT